MSGSELRSGRNLEFGVDVSQVKLDGLEAHREPFGGLPWARTASCRRSLRAARDRFQVALCSPRSSDHAAVKPRASRSSTPPRPGLACWRAASRRRRAPAVRPAIVKAMQGGPGILAGDHAGAWAPAPRAAPAGNSPHGPRRRAATRCRQPAAGLPAALTPHSGRRH